MACLLYRLERLKPRSEPRISPLPVYAPHDATYPEPVINTLDVQHLPLNRLDPRPRSGCQGETGHGEPDLVQRADELEAVEVDRGDGHGCSLAAVCTSDVRVVGNLGEGVESGGLDDGIAQKMSEMLENRR